MVKPRYTDRTRINARKTDVFDIFNFKYYPGPNPYLDTRSLVFDCALTRYEKPLGILNYVAKIGDRYPQIKGMEYDSYPHLLARVVGEVGKLKMNLHLNCWSIQANRDYMRIANQCLHEQTSRAVVYLVWDWLEAITQGEEFPFELELQKLQTGFQETVYGGQTVLALQQTAHNYGIPSFYLSTEGLMQYGYGKKQVRGLGGTFDHDSYLDSEFTTRKDDCKEFLENLGFPVPTGEAIATIKEAIAGAKKIGYPVTVKPVRGRKGIGVTSHIQNEEELIVAYNQACLAIPASQSTRIIIEKNILGKDFRLLCVNGKFVSAIERYSATVTDNSDLIIDTSEITNINVTRTIHDDNITLAEDIAQYFQLTCLSIDIIAENIATSWKNNNFSILEINSSPGISAHINPTLGESIDVAAHILATFFPTIQDAKIPIITFNRISAIELQITVNHILAQHPKWKIGALCREGIFINRAQKIFNQDYNSNVEVLLRHPQLDLLITEYPESILKKSGMFYQGSSIVILDHPSEIEMMLMRDIFDNSIVIMYKDQKVSIHRQGVIEPHILNPEESLAAVYLQQISYVLNQLKSPKK